MRWFSWGENFALDIRFGARRLSKTPGFTSIAALSLALGIGASTAIYSVVNAVILNPFPYKDVDTLMSVRVWEAGRQGGRTGYTPGQFLEIAERNSIFEAVIASTISDVLWLGQGEPQRLRGNHVTRETFAVMGVPALLGRVLVPADFATDAQPVCVLGYRFWQRQFGGSPGVLGGELRLNGVIRTVVGIVPRSFMWRGADVYIPIVLRRGEEIEGVRYVHLLGRLKRGVTEAQAESDLTPIIEDLRKLEPEQFPEKWRVGLLSFRETFPSSIRQALWILFGAVGLLLLISCANVSNLLLAKATGRQKEMAIRAALGADRGRLLRQLLTESLMLALMGGILGATLAYGSLKAILTIVPPGTIPDEAVIAINTPVLLFTLAVCALTTLLFGLAPALHTCTAELANPLRESGRGTTGGLRQIWLRGGLVVTEVALSLMLLAGASLMVRTVLAMGRANLGIRTDRILTMRVPLNPQRYPDSSRRGLFFQELLDRVAAIAGVNAVGVNTGMHPLGNWNFPVEIPGAVKEDQRPVLVHQVNEDYIRAYGIPLLHGRMFTRNEVTRKQHLALVNQAFLRRYLSGMEPLGRIFRVPRLRRAPFELADDSFQIVGVAQDTVNRVLADEILPEIYLPFTITGLADQLIVMAGTDPMAIADTVRRQVYAVDPEQPVTDVRTVDAIINQYVFAEPRFILVLFAVFAGIGLALAVVGVYGIISHSVSQRTQEIGVRIALGANFGDIVHMVLLTGIKLLALGIVLGLAGGLAASRLLRGQIWNVSPFDPLSFALVSLILLVAGVQACLWPAWRAARVDPVIALRSE